MKDNESKQAWLELFPRLHALDERTLAELSEAIQVIHADAGTVLFREESPCPNYLMMIDGCVRVQKVGESGQIGRASCRERV